MIKAGDSYCEWTWNGGDDCSLRRCKAAAPSSSSSSPSLLLSLMLHFSSLFLCFLLLSFRDSVFGFVQGRENGEGDDIGVVDGMCWNLCEEAMLSTVKRMVFFMILWDGLTCWKRQRSCWDLVSVEIWLDDVSLFHSMYFTCINNSRILGIGVVLDWFYVGLVNLITYSIL